MRSSSRLSFRCPPEELTVLHPNGACAEPTPHTMKNITIKLGSHWQRFVPTSNGLALLGSVQQGAAIGALARSSDGAYWQINGDHRRKLNASKVAAALRLAERWVAANTAGLPSATAPAKRSFAPTVFVKRRRVLTMQEV